MSVWIAEDIEHHWVLTGRFSGHLERGDELVERFSDLDAEQAIACGRARADVVLIRLGDGDYRSAGRRNPSPERFPTWPPAGPRPGFESGLPNAGTPAWSATASSSMSSTVPRRPFTNISA